jgi:hypothetical protein
MQNDFDLEESKKSFEKELIKIRTYSELKELAT